MTTLAVFVGLNYHQAFVQMGQASGFRNCLGVFVNCGLTVTPHADLCVPRC